MKVVLFCGGEGLRIREFSNGMPKPMVNIGYRPILWHVMKYYSHFGHKEFILCLGYKADEIKNYFLNYNEYLTNDFVLAAGGRHLNLLKSDIHDWKITFVDTGETASIGERLLAVRDYVGNDDMFLANYADCLTDLSLPGMTDFFEASGKTACFLTIRPNYTFHVVDFDSDGGVRALTDVKSSGIMINGGYFAFRPAIFDSLRLGEDLVDDAFQRLTDAGELLTYRYDGFWACMDTFKEKMHLERLSQSRNAPWEVWRHSAPVARLPGYEHGLG